MLGACCLRISAATTAKAFATFSEFLRPYNGISTCAQPRATVRRGTHDGRWAQRYDTKEYDRVGGFDELF